MITTTPAVTYLQDGDRVIATRTWAERGRPSTCKPITTTPDADLCAAAVIAAGYELRQPNAARVAFEQRKRTAKAPWHPLDADALATAIAKGVVLVLAGERRAISANEARGVVKAACWWTQHELPRYAQDAQ